MKRDLKDTTFIIPICIESEDRMRNVITSLCYILDNFDTKVILKEVDSESVFQAQALPQIAEYVEDGIENLTHIFEKKDELDPTFYRQRHINEMLHMVETEVTANYDCDVLLPFKTYLEAQQFILEEGYDVIYPYGQGPWQKKVYATDEMVSEFLSNDCKFAYLEKKVEIDNAESGHVQFIRTSSYREAGMENENFKAYAPEDKERIHRFTTLGYNVGRIENWVYHLEHARGDNSWLTNPHMQNNFALWEFLQSLDEEALRQYYKEQKYLKKYK
tara:strand:+ start:4557 stop:5378 length:822 start_codon:yes stop_codon:yes gene_type:complete